jgi:hypothetical protein
LSYGVLFNLADNQLGSFMGSLGFE